MNKRNDYGAKETVTNDAPTKETFTLMLPPLPGTDTAHPAFVDVPRGLIGTFPEWISVDVRWVAKGKFAPFIAAAIAHYWFEEARFRGWSGSLSTDGNNPIPLRRFISQQFWEWSAVAAGSRDYDGAELGEYQP